MTTIPLTPALQNSGRRLVGQRRTWRTPGLAFRKLQPPHDITVTGGLPASRPGLMRKGRRRETMPVPAPDDWSITVTRALGDFSRRLTEKLPANCAGHSSPQTKNKGKNK